MAYKKNVQKWLDKAESGETDVVKLQRLKHYYKDKKNLKEYLDIGTALLVLQFDTFRPTGRD